VRVEVAEEMEERIRAIQDKYVAGLCVWGVGVRVAEECPEHSGSVNDTDALPPPSCSHD
jgi:hypothetical protein